MIGCLIGNMSEMVMMNKRIKGLVEPMMSTIWRSESFTHLPNKNISRYSETKIMKSITTTNQGSTV